MNSSGNPIWARPLEEPIPCPECGSTSRVTRGLCLNCLLHQGFGDDAPTDETLELRSICATPIDASAIIRFSKKSGTAGWELFIGPANGIRDAS